jgi:hypothetical protein
MWPVPRDIYTWRRWRMLPLELHLSGAKIAFQAEIALTAVRTDKHHQLFGAQPLCHLKRRVTGGASRYAD